MTLRQVMLKTYYYVLPFSIRHPRLAARIRAGLQRALEGAQNQMQNDPDLKEAVDYIKKAKGPTAFPGAYQEKYLVSDISVQIDSDGFPYVLDRGKALYFPRGYGKIHTAISYNALLIEQDPESPHCYFSDTFFPAGTGEIFLDIGAAEAMLSLRCIDQVERCFIFECDKKWVEALHKTFAPYKDKVTIVNKFVSDHTEGDFVSLDDFIYDTLGIDGDRDLFCVKMDIEGAEADALYGCTKLLEQGHARFTVCTYHRPNDASKFTDLFQRMHYRTEATSKYMLVGMDGNGNYFFRRGVLRAWR